MKKLLIILFLLLVGSSQSFAGIRSEFHNLTVGGTTSNGVTNPGSPINNYVFASGATITSDSLYQTGSLGYNSSAIATQVSGGSVKISFQVSYDNITWFTPYTTSGGTITSITNLVTSLSANSWIYYQYQFAPYIRFIFQATGTPTITAEALWQDWL